MRFARDVVFRHDLNKNLIRTTNSSAKNTQRTKICRLHIWNNYLEQLLPSAPTPKFTKSYTENTQRPKNTPPKIRNVNVRDPTNISKASYFNLCNSSFYAFCKKMHFFFDVFGHILKIVCENKFVRAPNRHEEATFC